MTDEKRDKLDADDAPDGAARARRTRIQGEIEIAASDLELQYELGPGELAIEMLRTQMNRVLRHEGPEGYYRLVDRAIDVLSEQKAELDRIGLTERRRFAN